MRFVQLQDWLQWIEAQHPRQIDLGLDRVAAVYKTMGLHLNAPVITVAGTNGKGSCVALLSAILEAEGYRVGCYTSPHLQRYNERVRIDGAWVSDAALINAFDKVDRARGDLPLSFFEFGTLAALQLFADAQLDAVVLEVGLGGRLDAVNIVDADVALISSIDIDHEAWLGSDRETIGREKAGIARSGKPLIFGDHRPCHSVEDVASELGAPFYARDQHFSFSATADAWQWQGQRRDGSLRRLSGLPLPAVMLDNAAAVIQAVQMLPLPVSEAALREGLAEVRIAARGELLALREHALLLDVAHNAAALAKLAEQLATRSDKGRVVAVFAVMADKHIEASLSAFSGLVDHWYLPELAGVERAMAAPALAQQLRKAGIPETAIDCCGDVGQDLPGIRAKLNKGDCLVVFGSFFTVAAVMQALPPSAFVETLH